MSKADKIMGRTRLPNFGHDSQGNPITAGGEIVERGNYVTKDRYLKERAILENYNKIRDLNNELADLKEA